MVDSRLKRKYSIGDNLLITDDGYYIQAEVKLGNGSTSSIGVRRPTKMPNGSVKATYSLDGKYFYLPSYAEMHGWWLGDKKWVDLGEMKAQQCKGIMGVEYASFQLDTGDLYYREILSFTYWKVKSNATDVNLLPDDDRVLDYLALCSNRDRDQEKRFNEVIKSSGKDLDWIVEKIGPWSPVAEVPIIELN